MVNSFLHCGWLYYHRVCCDIATKKPEADRATGLNVFPTREEEAEIPQKGVLPLCSKRIANIVSLYVSINKKNKFNAMI